MRDKCRKDEGKSKKKKLESPFRFSGDQCRKFQHGHHIGNPAVVIKDLQKMNAVEIITEEKTEVPLWQREIVQKRTGANEKTIENC